MMKMLLRMRRMTLAAMLVMLFVTAAVSGQAVHGLVTGSDVDDPLIAATIYVKGTTTGTVTDYNGEYILPLKEGSYTLQISYMGYATQEKEISLSSGQDMELNIALDPAAIMGEEVVVTVQARGQLAAVNQQLRSNQIVNVVSSEKIKELPDENAAQAISRLPGVHLDGSKVVVRGIQSKMNKIMINGVAIPSTEAENRATDLGFISANQLSGIEVFKTLTPNMDADAIGGVVNLTLAEARKGFHYSVTAQGSYNAQEKYIGGSKVWLDVSNRFLDDKIGLSVNLNYEGSKSGSDRIAPGYAKLGGGAIGEEQYMFANVSVYDNLTNRTNYGGNLVVDYKFPRGKIVYTGIYNHSLRENIQNRDLMGASNGWTQRYLYLNHDQTPTDLLNNSLRYEHQIGGLKVKASVSAISVNKPDDWRYEYRYAYQGDAFDPNILTNPFRLQMEPHQMYEAEIPQVMDNFIMWSFNHRPQSYKESQLIASLDLEYNLNITDFLSANIRVGGKYNKMERTYDESNARYGDDITSSAIHAGMSEYIVEQGQTQWDAALQFPIWRDADYEVNKGFMNNSEYWRMDYVLDVDKHKTMAVDLMDYSTLQIQPEMWQNDYWGGESLLAGYAMAEIDLWKRLLIIPGVRVEQVTNDYVGMEVAYVSKNSPRLIDTLTAPVTHTHVLPHLHAKLTVTDWLDVRFSYNKTLSRPDYNYAIPSLYYDVIATTGVAGNPYVKPAVSENLDANITIYSRKLGLFTVGGFMKTIDDVFYMQPSLIENIPDTTIINSFPLETYPALAKGATDFYINNPYPAYLKGLEVEWQSNFSWLPSPFNGLVLNVNYTHVWSETKYVQHRLINEPIPVPPFVTQVEADTFYVNRLLHQANDIANVSLGYDYKGFSARLSFRFQGNVINGIGVRYAENTYTNNIYKYDFVAKQRIPVKNMKLEVFFNAINFTNVPTMRYQVYPNKGETNTYTNYTGRRFQLGLRLML